MGVDPGSRGTRGDHGCVVRRLRWLEPGRRGRGSRDRPTSIASRDCRRQASHGTRHSWPLRRLRQTFAARGSPPFKPGSTQCHTGAFRQRGDAPRAGACGRPLRRRSTCSPSKQCRRVLDIHRDLALGSSPRRLLEISQVRRRLILFGRHQDTRAIQGWLGHRSITSTAVYTALAPNRFKDFCRD
jgi:hypothetical protein